MKARHLRVIRDIQDGIPKELLENLTRKELQSPTLKHLAVLALKKPDSEVPQKSKRRIQAMLDSGYLDKEVEVINQPIEKQIEAYIEAEIAAAVKQGRLPKAMDPLQLKSKINKGKQYARRQHARLKALMDPQVSNVANGAQDGGERPPESPARGTDGGILSDPGQ